MAYVRKRGSSWSYTIDIGADPVTGKRRQATKGGYRTKREAELAAAKAETEVAGGTFVQEQSASFRSCSSTWMEQYGQGIISKRPKPSSIRQREFQVAVWLRYFDAIKISDITPKLYQEALIEMSKTMERNTVLGVHGVGRMIFRRAKQDGVIKSDPTEFAKVPADEEDEEEELPEYLEKDQLAKLLQLSKRRGFDQDYSIFLTLSFTGMRVGELCALRWENVDVDAQTITIKGTIYNPEDRSDKYKILPPKTKNSRRTIEVDKVVIAELERIRAKQNEFKMQHRKDWHDGGFVFARMDRPNKGQIVYGYPFKRATVEYRIKRLAQWMPIAFPLTPHILRHTHASLLAEAGATLEAIQERLGHKNERTTKLIYLHVTKTVKRETADKFGALMGDVVKM